MKERGVAEQCIVILLASIIALMFIALVQGTTANLVASQTSNYIDGDIDQVATEVIGTNNIRVGDVGFGSDQYRSFVDFDTSSIPDAATVSSVSLRLTVQALENGGTFSVNVYSLSQKADTRIDASQQATLNAECAGTGSTLILSSSASFSGGTLDDPITVALDAAAVTALENQLSSDFFSVCVKRVDESAADGEAGQQSTRRPGEAARSRENRRNFV